MKLSIRACTLAGLLLLPAIPSATAQPQPSPTPGVPATTEKIVVSADKVPEDPINVSGSVSVVSGEELRRRGAHTVADALQDVVGLDTGNGSDNGPRLPNIGLWGLKEFDALLVTVDGVPVGGPFNPSLTQIPVEDIEHIEVVRGPQGTLYGVSAFAGMIQVFTRHGGAGGSVRAGGGSFNEWFGNASYTEVLPHDLTIRGFGAITRSDGWQDRTDYKNERFNLNFDKKWGASSLTVNADYFRDTNFWGSPLPVDAGEPVPGFFIDRNYAVIGARQDHHVFALYSTFSTPISQVVKFENTLGFTRDNQISVRSFPHEFEEDTAGAEGVLLKPQETT